MNAIEIKNLSKSFRGMYAVERSQICLVGGVLFAVGLGAIGKVILKKTSLV